MSHQAARQPIRKRIIHELQEYATIAVYLWLCMGALLIYKGALLQAEGISYVPYGVAAVKALILGKFMMVGHAMRLGHDDGQRPLIVTILYKTGLFLLLLFALNIIEELVVGLLHHRSVTATLSDLAGGTVLQLIAVCLLFLLILLPYFTFREVAEALGPGTLRRLLFSTTPPRRGSEQ